jgi:hypothetical protein
MVCNGGEYQWYHIGSPRVIGLTYMVGIIPLNLRSQETDKGVPHARACRRRPGRAGRGVAWRGEAGRQAASGRGVVALIFSTH